MGNKTADQREVRYIVSSCLVGLKTRYDGSDKLCEKVRNLVEKGIALPFCPEQGGGLPTPRTPAEIVGGDGFGVLAGNARVENKNGADVTEEFIRGAKEMLRLSRLFGASCAILKDLSPSCGVGSIYNGTFSGNIIEGDGVATAILKKAGLAVITEKELKDD